MPRIICPAAGNGGAVRRGGPGAPARPRAHPAGHDVPGVGGGGRPQPLVGRGVPSADRHRRGPHPVRVRAPPPLRPVPPRHPVRPPAGAARPVLPPVPPDAALCHVHGAVRAGAPRSASAPVVQHGPAAGRRAGRGALRAQGHVQRLLPEGGVEVPGRRDGAVVLGAASRAEAGDLGAVPGARPRAPAQRVQRPLPRARGRVAAEPAAAVPRARAGVDGVGVHVRPLRPRRVRPPAEGGNGRPRRRARPVHPPPRRTSSTTAARCGSWTTSSGCSTGSPGRASSAGASSTPTPPRRAPCARARCTRSRTRPSCRAGTCTTCTARRRTPPS